MTSLIFSWAAAALLLVTSAGLILSRDWRWSLGFLAAQYFGMFWLVTVHWPFGLASVKLVTGWMVSAILGMTRLSMGEEGYRLDTGQGSGQTAQIPQGRLFRSFAAAIVITLVIAATPQVAATVAGISLPVAAGALLLAGMGLLHLGITTEPLRALLGLLTTLSGFEILYAAVETSILLAGLLAVVNLGLALTGAYLMVAAAAAADRGEAEE